MGFREREPASSPDFPTPSFGKLEGELFLERDGGVLFAPELEQEPWQPAPVGAQFVDDGMAGRAEGNHPLRSVDPWLPVMDGALVPCPAALALEPIAGEDDLADAGEIAKRVAALPVAGAAEAGNFRWRAASRAEQPFLAQKGHGPV